MKLDKGLATAHASLNGWSLVTYQTGFDGATGYGLWSKERGEWVRTLAADTPVTRSTIQSSHMTEVSPDTVPETVFWRLFDRLILLDLLPVLPGYRVSYSLYGIDYSPGDDHEYAYPR